MNSVKNRTTRFLIVSVVCIFSVLILVFALMTYLMNRRSAEVIGQLGGLYMAGMSEQAATHFGTTIELRLSQVNALVDSVPPGTNLNFDTARISLSYNARARGFDHLAFFRPDGTFEMLYGSNMTVNDTESFLHSLESGEDMMSIGSDESGEAIVLMGIPAVISFD